MLSCRADMCLTWGICTMLSGVWYGRSGCLKVRLFAHSVGFCFCLETFNPIQQSVNYRSATELLKILFNLPKYIFYAFVYLSQWTAIISLSSINLLFLVKDTQCIFCEEGNVFLFIIIMPYNNILSVFPLSVKNVRVQTVGQLCLLLARTVFTLNCLRFSIYSHVDS